MRCWLRSRRINPRFAIAGVIAYRSSARMASSAIWASGTAYAISRSAWRIDHQRPVTRQTPLILKWRLVELASIQRSNVDQCYGTITWYKRFSDSSHIVPKPYQPSCETGQFIQVMRRDRPERNLGELLKLNTLVLSWYNWSLENWAICGW